MEKERDISRNNASFTFHLTKLDYGIVELHKKLILFEAACVCYSTRLATSSFKKGIETKSLRTQMNLR